eukprot:GILJ01001253.1.p1 GENE.GILJ01001253.1~~GILJ01001253.1.p1  ORF type:complete len:430 (+),score=65.78 GILJ01001253.1:59-1291(+)
MMDNIVLGVAGHNPTAKSYLERTVLPHLNTALNELLRVARERGELSVGESDHEGAESSEDEEERPRRLNALAYLAEALKKLNYRKSSSDLLLPEDTSDNDEEHTTIDSSPRPHNFHRVRRTNVCSESLPEDEGEWNPPVYEKTADQVARIRHVLSGNILLQALEEDEMRVITNAMFERSFPAGQTIIEQGEDGDNFYVLDEGQCKCYVTPKGGSPKLVLTYEPGMSFGELALMYNAPRAATVQASLDCRVWALDRMTFKRVLMATSQQKRDVRYAFLDQVPLFDNMSRYEKLKLLEAIRPCSFEDGSIIIKEGTPGTQFYIVESGEACCTKVNSRGQPEEVYRRLRCGDYFGEIALIKDQPRAATVTAVGTTKVLGLEKDAFRRLLGPLEEILQRNMETYTLWETRLLKE